MADKFLTNDEIVEQVQQHLINDVSYKMFSNDKNGFLQLWENQGFQIVNSIPENHPAPFFQIKNIDQARQIVKQIVDLHQSDITVEQIDEKFDLNLASFRIDPLKPLYFSWFRPDRIS